MKELNKLKNEIESFMNPPGIFEKQINGIKIRIEKYMYGRILYELYMNGKVFSSEISSEEEMINNINIIFENDKNQKAKIE